MSSCGYCGKTMLDNSLVTSNKDVHGNPKLIKRQSTLSFSTSSSSGSKCKKCKQDNYDIESIFEMDTDHVSVENWSPSPGFLPLPSEKRLWEEEVLTAWLSKPSVTSLSSIPLKVDEKLDFIIS